MRNLRALIAIPLVLMAIAIVIIRDLLNAIIEFLYLGATLISGQEKNELIGAIKQKYPSSNGV